MRHTTTPIQSPANNPTGYGRMRLTFSVPSSYNNQAVWLYGIEWWGSYPSGTRNVYTIDASKNVIMPAGMTLNGNLTITGDIVSYASLDYVNSNYTVDINNINNVIEASGNITITLPNSLSAGFQTTIVNVGPGVITLNASTLLSTDSSVALRNRYAGASAIHKGTGIS